MVAMLSALVLLQSTPNTLTEAEKAAGWRLLFDGKTTAGWKNFKSDTVGEGWQVKDGALVCADPHHAGGDLLTKDVFGWFEFVVDIKVEKGQNSGIMFHVQNEGDATWHTGPEIQIFDNASNPGVQKLGWLYELYPSPVDASKPAGEWNTLRMVLKEGTSSVWLNGTKYYDFELGSKDFQDRVAKSKFGVMPNFAKKRSGHLAFQGDHGVVSFRNIKIRPIQ